MKRISLIIMLASLISCSNDTSDNSKYVQSVTTDGLIIFVTQGYHVSDFANDPTLVGSNAIEKADSFCNSDANKPNGSTYKALLTDGIVRDAVSLTDWVLEADTTYYRSNGNVVIGTTTNSAIFAVLFTDLTNSISDRLPNTGFAIEVNKAFTGIANASDFSANSSLTCNSWSYAGDSYTHKWGYIFEKTERAFVSNSSQSCSEKHHLYCVEQP